MAAFAFVNYIRFKQYNSSNEAYEFTAHSYQNFSVNEVRERDGVRYQFLPFAVSTGAGSKGGDRSSAQLVAGLNQITVNVLAEAVRDKWLLDLKTVSIDPNGFGDQALIHTETWRVASYRMDTERITLTLSSPLDAASSDVPRRSLSTNVVGALPSSGSLTVS